MAALAAHQASYEAVAKAAAKAREDAARKNATDEPRAPDAHGTLSDALRELGRLPEARAAAQEAARLNPAAWRAHAKAMYRRA